MKIKSLGHCKKSGVSTLSIRLSNNEYKKLRSAGYDYCVEEIIKVYYPLQVEKNYTIIFETSKSSLEVMIIDVDLNENWEVTVKANNKMITIVSKRKPQKSSLSYAVVRELVKDGTIASLY